MIHIQSKCLMLYMVRQCNYGNSESGITYEWLRYWQLTGDPKNPPNIQDIPLSLEYLRCYALERAYMQTATSDQSISSVKKNMYRTLRFIRNAGSPPTTLRVKTIHPDIAWETVWKNISNSWTEESVRSTWYEVAHDLIPTNVRLHKIRISETEDCRHCGKKDQLAHRLTECGAAETIWAWTRTRISWFLRMDQKWMPDEWLWAPSYSLWPAQRNRATSWILAHMIHYVLNNNRALSMEDYIDYMQRARWKSNQQKDRIKMVGRYLDVLG